MRGAVPSASPQLTIDARVRKDLFISMLVRDININAAIVDLIDNSVDGAIRCRKGKGYKGLWVHIGAAPDHFTISDNCGGIPYELARDYAFNFGRSPEAPELKHSVGEFGVGMKRALFKLGNRFRIESVSENSQFTVDVDVDEWRKDDTNWTFQFKDLKEGTTPPDKRGTVITITSLHEGVAKYFGFEDNINALRNEIGERHQTNIDRGMQITLNGTSVVLRLAQLLSSPQLRPAYYEKTVPAPRPSKSSVRVRIWAGLGRSGREDPLYAGWYVFCNGRMVLLADQTRTTGWGEGGETTIPKYHNQFARFRGYVKFDSDDGNVLPWNTTKTGLDEESWIYPSVKLEMVTLMRPVIDFLNLLDKEGKAEGGATGPLHMAVDKVAKLSKLETVEVADRFVAPKAPPPAPEMRTITYKKPVKDIDRVRRLLKVQSYREVGERTFDYYLKMEGS